MFKWDGSGQKLKQANVDFIGGPLHPDCSVLVRKVFFLSECCCGCVFDGEQRGCLSV